MARRRWDWGRRGSDGAPPDPAHARASAGIPAKVYARAFLERAEITEEYHVRQRVSKNSSIELGEGPVGRIELAMPYDGHKYFTRAASDDVAQQIAPYSQPGSSAVIGHLLLKDYSRTSLRERLPLGNRSGSVPTEVPLDDRERSGLDHLSGDQRIGTTTVEFEPADPEVIPAKLDIDLFDPDSLDLPFTDLGALDLQTDEARQRINEDIKKIAQPARFRGELLLRIIVRLSLPAHPDLARRRPRVVRVAIEWPTITSLGTLRLQAGGARPVRYNPLQRCIEWENVPMFAVGERRQEAAKKRPEPQEPGEPEGSGDAAGSEEEKEPRDLEAEEHEAPETDSGAGEDGEDEEDSEDESDTSGMRQYESVPMVLSIGQPGELYKQRLLRVAAEVRVRGYLMSGTTARLYDATGYYRKDPLTLTTRIHATANLILDEAFDKRDRSPSQHLFFDEIVPEDMRITDLRIALQDRGFDVLGVWTDNDGAAQGGGGISDRSWRLLAHRMVGPDDMFLLILVVGRSFGAQRHTVMPGGGITHLTELPSGEFRIFVRGSLPRDSEGRLTYEMNMLHGMLRERYGRVRQRR
jgi:hypothetical protein